AFEGTRWTVAGQVGRAQGNHHPSIAPYGLFRTSDGAVQIAVGSESLWMRLGAMLGLDPADERFASNALRVENRRALIEVLERAFSEWTAAELLRALAEAGVPAGKVRTIDEVYEWEQTRSQGLVIDVGHTALGRISLPGPPLRFFTPEGDETTRREHRPPPLLGEHNAAVRESLGRRV